MGEEIDSPQLFLPKKNIPKPKENKRIVKALPKRRRKKKINQKEDNWLEETIEKLDHLNTIDEYMTSFHRKCDELNSFQNGGEYMPSHECTLPYSTRRVSHYKYRSTMWKVKIGKDL